MQRIVFFVIASAPKASLRESEAISTGRLDRDCRGHMLWPPKEIDGFCCGRIEIATVAALLRNDIRGLFSFLCILRIRSGARNDKRFIFMSLRAWPQGADSKNRAAISGVTMRLFQQPHSHLFLCTVLNNL